jgi:glycosyltransferase involved in cell wall biosynthesis
MKATLVLLTKNEIEGLRAVFPQIDASAFEEILAFDGGSSDGTREFLRERGVVPQAPVGYGKAFQLAAEQARGDVVVFFRPDGNEDPSDIPRLLRGIEDGADHVIASRFLPGARNEDDGRPFAPRRVANRFFTRLANFLFNRTGKPVSDSINGFRALRREALREIGADAPGFSVEFQMTIRSLKLKHVVIELPTREGDRIGGTVKARSIPVGLEMCRTLILEWIAGTRPAAAKSRVTDR